VDVGIIFWIDSFEFRVESFVTRSGETRISFGDLDEGIPFVEVGVVVISGQPGCCGIGDLVGLWGEGFVLNKASEWFCISEVFRTIGVRSYACTQFLLVITTSETIYLLELW
jgi:hypothetical protein